MESRLFHAVVVMGLSFGAGCGGSEANARDDGGTDAANGRADSAVADATRGGDGASVDGPPGVDTGTSLSGDAGGDANDGAAPDGAYGYEDDAGMCVCPGSRPPGPCCPPAYGVCSPWPCYV